MMRRLAIALALAACACTRPYAPAGSPERCARLDDQRLAWGAVWKASAVASAGLATPAVAADGDGDPTLRRGLAWGALGAAVITAGAAYIQEGAGETYALQCKR